MIEKTGEKGIVGGVGVDRARGWDGQVPNQNGREGRFRVGSGPNATKVRGHETFFGSDP